jgi:hypothetical protein
MAYFVICASPLVKSFLREWHPKLMKDPNVLFDAKVDFEFDVEHGCSAFRMKFNKPVPVQGKNDKETENLYNWLIGGETGREYPETNWTGIVPFDPNLDLVTQIDEINTLESLESEDPKEIKAARERLIKMQDEMRARLKETRAKVREGSAERIMEAMRGTHRNLLAQWRISEESNLARHAPSVSELMGAHALAGEREREEKEKKKLLEHMNDLMKNVIV